MADPIFSPINIVAKKDIYPMVIDDVFFTTTPFFTRLRQGNVKSFTGGAFGQSVFRYAPMIGGSYRPGATFAIEKRNTLAATAYDQRFYQVSIPEMKEELQVYAKGENAVFSMLDEDLENALSSIETMIAIAAWQQGQSAPGGTASARQDDINGMSEAINDGTVYSWDGTIASTYLEATRNGVVGSTINSVPAWIGQSNGSTGPISFQAMEENYRDACRGPEEPDLIVMNKAAFSYCKEKIEPSMRYNQETDVLWGGSGFRFNKAMVLVDDYCPSARYGLTDDQNLGLGNFQTGTITNALTGTPAGGFPTTSTASTLTVGEVIFMLNTKYWTFLITDDDEFGFGFSGFMGAQDSNKVVGRIQAACNLICPAGSRYQKQLLGIGG